MSVIQSRYCYVDFTSFEGSIPRDHIPLTGLPQEGRELAHSLTAFARNPPTKESQSGFKTLQTLKSQGDMNMLLE